MEFRKIISELEILLRNLNSINRTTRRFQKREHSEEDRNFLEGLGYIRPFISVVRGFDHKEVYVKHYIWTPTGRLINKVLRRVEYITT